MPFSIGPFSFQPRDFLSKTQEDLTHPDPTGKGWMLKPTVTRRDLRKANDEALQAGIRASLHHDDGLTAAQKFARETGDPELIEEANQAAIDEAIKASRQAPKHPSKPVRNFIPDEEFKAQQGLVARLKNWLIERGFIIKPNNGHQNNCLLISMLQHVTGDYDPNSQRIQKAAEDYKALIVAWSGGQERPISSLFSEGVLIDLIVDQINQDYFGTSRDKYIQFRFLTPSLDGEPAERYVGTGPRIEGILDGGGHYEAFVKQPNTR